MHLSRHDIWRSAISLLCLALLMGCGSTASSGLRAGNSAGTTTPTGTATFVGTLEPGGAALNGCQTQPPATFTTKAPDSVLTQKNAQSPVETPTPAVALSVGQVVEVRLVANVRWNLNPTGAAGLRLESPPSLYDGANKLCLWRFTAIGGGQQRLSFSGGLVCDPHVACPALAAIADFAIAIA